VRPTGPWVGEDIGAIGIPGADNGDPVTTAMTGSGADIWGTADAFRFRYASNAGRGLSARVLTIENTHEWAKAGVMIRDNLTPGSPHAMMIISAGRGVAFQFRTTQGGQSFSSAPVMRTVPQWVRLRREGNFFLGEASHDGVSWFEAGRATIAAIGEGIGGLVVTSHDNTHGATATFDDIVVP
jgi:hypothetical protein